MTGSRKVFAALLAASLFVGTTAFAEPSQQDKERARDLMAEGRDRREKTDLAGALESFRQADAIMHVPTTGYEVARTQQLLGQLLEARETALAIGKLPTNPSDPPPFAEARQKAEALLKELDKQIPQIKVAIKSSDPKLAPTVTVDDAPLASLDAPARVNPGKHVVVARAEGSEVRQDVSIGAGETKEVELRFESKAVVVAPAAPASSKSKIPTLSLIGFGVAGAGLLVGTITGIMAMSAEGDISDDCPAKRCPQSAKDDLDSAKTKATISTIGFVVAGIGAAVGVVGFFVQPKTEAKVGNVTFDFARMRGTF